MNIIALTCLSMDLYPDQDLECVGGNALNVAVQCKRSGADSVSVLGAVGMDAYGETLLHYLEDTDIDASHVYRCAGATATHRLYLTRGSRQEQPGLWQGGVFDTFRLSDTDWDFVNTHDIVAIGAFDPNFKTALQEVAPQCKIVADFLDIRDFDYMASVINRLSIAVLNGLREDVERARVLSAQHKAIILITLGAEGSVAAYRGQIYKQSALSVAEVVDTTGCGDAFQAAFIVSWFQEYDIHQSMQAGTEAAARLLAHFGGTEAGSMDRIE
ncbi:MAG: carbohydrate kinase family protein [Anaerolineae bacterium]|nr:carbohydrate kinase family protein [Anaerolineae bacterium]